MLHYITLNNIYSGQSYDTASPLEKKSQEGKERENKKVLRRLRKTVKVGADVMSLGILFQSLPPATGKARSPTVINLVDGTISAPDDDERSSLRPVSATRLRLSARYRGARPCRHW